MVLTKVDQWRQGQPGRRSKEKGLPSTRCLHPQCSAQRPVSTRPDWSQSCPAVAPALQLAKPRHTSLHGLGHIVMD